MELLNLKDFFNPKKGYTLEQYQEHRGYFLFYDLLDEEKIYPPNLLGKWLYTRTTYGKGLRAIKNVGELSSETYACLKAVSEESFNSLYCRYFNPVSLRVFKYQGDGENRYTFTAMIHSIDDAAYGVVFNNILYSDIETIRNNFFEYVDSQEVIDIKDFVEFGIKLGGKNNNW